MVKMLRNNGDKILSKFRQLLKKKYKALQSFDNVINNIYTFVKQLTFSSFYFECHVLYLEDCILGNNQNDVFGSYIK